MLLDSKRALEIEKQQCVQKTNSDITSVTPCGGATELERLRSQLQLLLTEKKLLDIDRKLWTIDKATIDQHVATKTDTLKLTANSNTKDSQLIDELQAQLSQFQQMRQRVQDNSKLKKIEIVEGYLQIKDTEVKLRSSILDSAIEACQLQSKRESLSKSGSANPTSKQALTKEIRHLLDTREQSAIELAKLTYGRYWLPISSISEDVDEATARQLQAIDSRCHEIELEIQKLNGVGQ